MTGFNLNNTLRTLSTAALLSFSGLAMALPIQQNTIVQTQMNRLSIQKQASMWGLTSKDYQRYVWLMHNTPSGHWYKNLDPAEVLALNAKNPNDMTQYAKIQARNMHARVTRELAFNVLYNKAYRELYPNEKAIESPLAKQTLNQANLKSGDHIWLFTGIKTPLGGFAYQHLVKLVEQTPNTMLDIYFVGKNLKQRDIQQWAINQHMPANLVNQKVTLNYANDRLESITKSKSVNLPYIGLVHDGRFQAISLSSVL